MKKHKPLPNYIIKKISALFPEEGHIYMPYNNVWFYNAIGNMLITGTAYLFFQLLCQSLKIQVFCDMLERL